MSKCQILINDFFNIYGYMLITVLVAVQDFYCYLILDYVFISSELKSIFFFL
jgi:hypothetical protein